MNVKRKLHADVVTFLEEQRATGFANCAPQHRAALEIADADHGRIEVRRHWIIDDIDWLKWRHSDGFLSRRQYRNWRPNCWRWRE